MFIVMIVFQLSGALILLYASVNTRKEKIIQNCFPGSNFVTRDNENKCVIQKEKLQKSAHTIYLNITTFINLVIGYALAAFSFTQRLPTFLVVILIICGSIVLSWGEYCLCRSIARRKYAEDRIVSYNDLEPLGVESPATLKEAIDYLEMNNRTTLKE